MELAVIIIIIVVALILLLSMLLSIACYCAEDESSNKLGLKAQWVASVSLIILIALVLFICISE